jgi:chemosensory pili system protein ChpA (sensor histidine kinase/response regulator)
MTQLLTESDSVLTTWQRINSLFITQDDTTESEDFNETDQRSETLEKLALGLHLLRGLKTVQNETQHSNIAIEPLHTDSTIEDYIRAIQTLSEQAASDDDYDLQDTALLLEDALRELPANELAVTKFDLLSAVEGWLPVENKKTPPIAQSNHELSQDNNLEASEHHSERTTLEKLRLGLHLLRELKIAQHETHRDIVIESLLEESSIDDYTCAVQKLSEQATLNDDYDLQDACLLIEDALSELVPNEFAIAQLELLSTINDWSLIACQTPLNPVSNEENNTEATYHLNNPEQHTTNETLEKLQLGLQLLRELKIAETQQNDIPIEPLHANSPIEAYISAMQMLSEQAAFDGNYDLQDTALLLEDVLSELPANEFTVAKFDVLTVISDWLPVIEENYIDIIQPSEELNGDDDNIAVDDIDESEQYSDTLEKLRLDIHLLGELKITRSSTQQSNLFIKPLYPDSSVKEHIQAIQTLYEQAVTNDDFELQDACLLLEDALSELPANEFTLAKFDLLAAINDWLPVIDKNNNDIIQDDNAEVNYLDESKQYSETLEKLQLGLQLLSELKIAQGEAGNNILIEPLHADSSVEQHFQTIQTLSEQAANHDDFDLQDACLLLEDALGELTADEFIIVKLNLLAAINAYALANNYQEKLPEPTVLISTDEEKPNANLTHHTFADYIVTIEKLAHQANDEGYSALHDVSQIIIEALHELSQESENSAVKSDLPSLLDHWSILIEAYRQKSPASVDGIMTILCHPDLNIPFDEDDFAVFTALLIEDITATNSLEETVDSPPNEIVSLPTVDTPSSTLVNEAVALTTTVAEIADDDNEVAAPLSAMAQELVELLDTEAGLLNYRFLTISFDDSFSQREEHLQLASEELERLSNASKMVGFEGLAQACSHINANISLYLQTLDSFTLAKRDLLTDWVSQVKAYLLSFSKNSAGKALLAQMTDSNWVQPLTAEASALLLPQMQVKGLSDDTAEAEKSEIFATDEDVSLALPDDVNKELLDLLLQELPGYTQQFSEAIQRLQGGGSSKDIDVAQRIAHTIKGSGNTVGIKGIAFLTHQIEDILMACAKAHKQPGAALINTLINASDCLEAMCESLLGFGEPPADARQVLQEVLDWAYQIAKNGIQVADSQNAPVKQSASVKSSDNDTAEQTPKDSKTTEQTESSQVAMVRVPTDQIENLFRLSSESIILNGQIYERQRRLKNQLQIMEAQFALLQQLGAGLEQLIDLKDLSGRSVVNTSKEFDALEMDQYNELHTASRRMVEASVDAREIGVDMKKELEYMNEVLEYQQRLVINTQEAVMQTRFVPVGSISLRLQRGLRQTCRLTGKQGELTLTGENLLIDGDTLSALVEPLMHLLRNAIDHGLESEEERIAMGKPPVGQIAIEFDREGNSILVRCRDDGRGLDFEAIRRTAEKRGDIQDGDAITNEELKRMILRPNFSTRNQLTQTSGRGVGMDVVNFQVLSLGGSLALHSVRGKGLTVELRMPLPLSRSHALIAYAASYKVAISSKGVTQVIYSGAGELTTISNEQVLVMGDDIYPVVKLEDLLHVVDRRKAKRPHSAVLLVQNEHKVTAVLVNTITDSREVVIKNLGYYMRKIHGFVGATILGDGSVTPVLDLPELLRAPIRTQVSSHTDTTERVDTGSGLPKILIVDDSLSQRRALQQILTDAGFAVQVVRDGIEAVEWMGHSKPDVLITDLEMPRMNGIELASHIRSHANIRHIPIIMITSRSTQKHRQMAEEAGVNFYLIKPVQDDDLLTKIQTLIDKQYAAVAV